MNTIVVDGNAVCHAAKHAFGPMSYEDAQTGIVYGFLARMLKFSRTLDSTKFVFAWDSRENFRKEVLPTYKEKNLPELTPEEIELNNMCYAQFPIIRTKVLPALGFKNIFIQRGREGDDIIASVVMNNNGPFIVLSDDNDLFQLLDYCDLWLLRKDKKYTKDNLKKDWGCTPYQWGQMKKYAGCKGDMVPGIPQVGYKRAINYVKGSLYGKFLEKCVTADKEFLNRNERLVVLPFEGTKVFKVEGGETFDFDKIMRTLEDYGMYSLLNGSYLQTWKRFCYGES